MYLNQIFNLILQRNNISGEDVNYLLAHQANERIIESVAEKMKLNPKMDPKERNKTSLFKTFQCFQLTSTPVLEEAL